MCNTYLNTFGDQIQVFASLQMQQHAHPEMSADSRKTHRRRRQYVPPHTAHCRLAAPRTSRRQSARRTSTDPADASKPLLLLGFMGSPGHRLCPGCRVAARADEDACSVRDDSATRRYDTRSDGEPTRPDGPGKTREKNPKKICGDDLVRGRIPRTATIHHGTPVIGNTTVVVLLRRIHTDRHRSIRHHHRRT